MDFFVYICRMLNGGRITKMLKRDISNMLGYVTEDLILTIGFKKSGYQYLINMIYMNWIVLL